MAYPHILREAFIPLRAKRLDREQRWAVALITVSLLMIPLAGMLMLYLAPKV